MLEISAFKSFTGHVFDNKEDCMAWESRARQMQAEVVDNLRNDLVISDIDSFPIYLIDIINTFKEDDYYKYLKALGKVPIAAGENLHTLAEFNQLIMLLFVLKENFKLVF